MGAVASIEDLKNTWISAGQKVSDLQSKINQMLVDESVSAEDLKAKQKDLETAKAKRDIAKQQYDDLVADSVKQPEAKKPAEPKAKNPKLAFVDKFTRMMRHDPQIMAELTSQLDTNGDGVGLTIPQDIQTQINTLKRQFNALEQYVTVVPTTMPTGSRVIEKLSDLTPLANIENEDGAIGDNDDPSFTLIRYAIKRYAGISTLTNTLLQDTAENILAYLTQWLAKKDAVTRNSVILTALASLPATQKKAITKVDELKDIFNVQLDPAIRATATFITNQSGFNVLDKVKDGNGQYLVQPLVTNPTQPTLFGRNIAIISDKYLPNETQGSGTSQTTVFPFYLGDLKQAVYLFDRQQMSLLSTNIGAGAFEHDTTKLRVIDRFDVELWDNESVVKATFSDLS